jgi:hypothetical protein
MRKNCLRLESSANFEEINSMKKATIIALLSLCASGLVSAAQVPRLPQAKPGSPVHIETLDLRDVRPYVDAATLVIIEIESTLMTSETMLGSEYWADLVQQYNVTPGGTLRQGRAAITPLWNKILREVPMRSLDMSMQAFVRGLQRTRIPVIGLSTKDPDMAYVMLNHLQSVDVDMTRSAPFAGHLNVAGAENPAKSINGVLFTGVLNDLGRTLAAFVSQLGMPTRVVMISHKMDHLREAFEAFNPHGVAFVGVRLGLADREAARFRPDIAEVQLNCFDRALSNEAAAQLRPRSSWFW